MGGPERRQSWHIYLNHMIHWDITMDTNSDVIYMYKQFVEEEKGVVFGTIHLNGLFCLYDRTYQF